MGISVIKTKSKYIIWFIIVPVIIILIYTTRYFVFTLHIEKLNPMSYVYKTSIDSVRRDISDFFSNGKFHDLDFEIGYNSSDREIYKIDSNDNKNHFFINWFGWNASEEDSKIYYNWWGKLKLIPSYHIILDSLSHNQTKITILSFPKVKAGSNFSFNHLLPYVTYRKVSVKPSSIEEYEIIRMIGERSGEKNMPLTLFPLGVSH